MTYNPEIPLVTESPQNSALPIQVNFAQFAAILSQLSGGVYYNHMPLNDANEGKHGAVIFQNQAADPGVTEDLTVLYSKNATQTAITEPQLFAQIPEFLPTNLDSTTAKNDPMLLTYSSVNLAGPVFYSFLPGGYLVYFGMVSAAGVSPTLVTLSPIPTQILTVIANPNNVEGGPLSKPRKISANIVSASTFNVYCGSTPFDFTWMAIAKT